MCAGYGIGVPHGAMDKSWIKRIYQEVGLETDQATEAERRTLIRLLSRERPLPEIPKERRSISDYLVRDPLVSFNRIIGRGDSGLPFYDDEKNILSAPAFSTCMVEAGIDPVVAMAFSRVLEEAYTAEDFYSEIWKGLGFEGAVDLEVLRRADWTPLRHKFPELEAHMKKVAVKPKARRPARRPGGAKTVKVRAKKPASSSQETEIVPAQTEISPTITDDEN